MSWLCYVAACPAGRWGRGCERYCRCAVDAVCDVAEGCSSCQHAGWTGANCDVDVDECLLQPRICGQHAVCTNNNGSYTCRCDDWYQRVGTSCQCKFCLKVGLSLEIKLLNKLGGWCALNITTTAVSVGSHAACIYALQSWQLWWNDAWNSYSPRNWFATLPSNRYFHMLLPELCALPRANVFTLHLISSVLVHARLVCVRSQRLELKGQLQRTFFYCRLCLDFVFILQIYMSNFPLKQLLVKKNLMIILFCANNSTRPEVYIKSPWRWPSPSGRKAVIGR